MVRLVLIFLVLTIEYVSGRPRFLPPLPVNADGCFFASSEVEMFSMEGEAMILSFPIFMRVLEVRKIAPKAATYSITKDSETEGVLFHGEGRVQQHDKQLWFLPAQASDSGEYTCTYRNSTYCVMGTIKLHVYKSDSVDMSNLSYPISASLGQNLKFSCPNLSEFNQTQELIEWYKNSSLTQVQPDGSSSSLRDTGDLMIPEVRRHHEGLYTCQLRVLINNQLYKVSRAVMLRVEGGDPVFTTITPHVSATSEQETTSSSTSSSTPHSFVIQPPVIVSPSNGTVFQGPHGLELFCKVLTACEMSDSTLVTWMVNGQSVESSYLDRRALQGGRRVTAASGGCQVEMRLIIVAVTDEDVKTELKCVTENKGGKQEVFVQLQVEDSTFTWLVFGTLAATCFLTVVMIFFYVLLKPKRKKKMDYFLARQNSTF
ncbi:interleukin-1 receptor type 2-like [Halichoeres trimaculatus]|uniref:interleukin-1 receptor type 2-like n=1 Tax=Halichoeres trimaculatus TaxID=147232 RepID=UPI003D9DF97A